MPSSSLRATLASTETENEQSTETPTNKLLTEFGAKRDINLVHAVVFFLKLIIKQVFQVDIITMSLLFTAKLINERIRKSSNSWTQM